MFEPFVASRHPPADVIQIFVEFSFGTPYAITECLIFIPILLRLKFPKNGYAYALPADNSGIIFQ